jgi:hypothetical protein
VPVILDTDHVTILQREGPEADRLLARLDQLPPDDIATTVVSYQEQLQGWLAFLRAYAELDKIRLSAAYLQFARKPAYEPTWRSSFHRRITGSVRACS